MFLNFRIVTYICVRWNERAYLELINTDGEIQRFQLNFTNEELAYQTKLLKFKREKEENKDGVYLGIFNYGNN